MAKEILVTELFSEQMILAGERLIDILDKFSCQVKAAFWMFSPEEKTWKLLLASPLVKQEGPRKYYKRIVDANKSLESGGDIISLNDITVSNVDTQIIQLLQSTVPTDDSISNIRFSKNTINGVFIDDVHIYRMNVNNR